MNFARGLLVLVVMALPSAASAKVYFNPKLIPTGHPGYTEDRVKATTDQPRPSDGTGAFRTVCTFSHMNQDDPIVFPGQKGAAHLHTYFGNKGTNFSSTSASIALTGASTCGGGTVNRSAYWMPSMIDTRKGRPLAPSYGSFYYKSGYHSMPVTSIQPIPVGLRMLAGTPRATGPNTSPSWSGTHNHYFSCHYPTGTGPSLRGESIPNCPVGSEVWMTVIFPQCWDGQNLDSPNHVSHMAYRSEGFCPASHPVAISEITLNIVYPVTVANAPLYWRLSSDDYSGPGGYSAHADWMNGWRSDVASRWNRNCIQAARDCGSGLLGDGLEIY